MRSFARLWLDLEAGRCTAERLERESSRLDRVLRQPLPRSERASGSDDSGRTAPSAASSSSSSASSAVPAPGVQRGESGRGADTVVLVSRALRVSTRSARRILREYDASTDGDAVRNAADGGADRPAQSKTVEQNGGDEAARDARRSARQRARAVVEYCREERRGAYAVFGAVCKCADDPSHALHTTSARVLRRLNDADLVCALLDRAAHAANTDVDVSDDDAEGGAVGGADSDNEELAPTAARVTAPSHERMWSAECVFLHHYGQPHEDASSAIRADGRPDKRRARQQQQQQQQQRRVTDLFKRWQSALRDGSDTARRLGVLACVLIEFFSLETLVGAANSGAPTPLSVTAAHLAQCIDAGTAPYLYDTAVDVDDTAGFAPFGAAGTDDASILAHDDERDRTGDDTARDAVWDALCLLRAVASAATALAGAGAEGDSPTAAHADIALTPSMVRGAFCAIARLSRRALSADSALRCGAIELSAARFRSVLYGALDAILCTLRFRALSAVPDSTRTARCSPSDARRRSQQMGSGSDRAFDSAVRALASVVRDTPALCRALWSDVLGDAHVAESAERAGDDAGSDRDGDTAHQLVHASPRACAQRAHAASGTARDRLRVATDGCAELLHVSARALPLSAYASFFPLLEAAVCDAITARAAVRFAQHHCDTYCVRTSPDAAAASLHLRRSAHDEHGDEVHVVEAREDIHLRYALVPRGAQALAYDAAGVTVWKLQWDALRAATTDGGGDGARVMAALTRHWCNAGTTVRNGGDHDDGVVALIGLWGVNHQDVHARIANALRGTTGDAGAHDDRRSAWTTAAVTADYAALACLLAQLARRAPHAVLMHLVQPAIEARLLRVSATPMRARNADTGYDVMLAGEMTWLLRATAVAASAHVDVNADGGAGSATKAAYAPAHSSRATGSTHVSQLRLPVAQLRWLTTDVLPFAREQQAWALRESAYTLLARTAPASVLTRADSSTLMPALLDDCRELFCAATSCLTMLSDASSAGYRQRCARPAWRGDEADAGDTEGSAPIARCISTVRALVAALDWLLLLCTTASSSSPLPSSPSSASVLVSLARRTVLSGECAHALIRLATLECDAAPEDAVVTEARALHEPFPVGSVVASSAVRPFRRTIAERAALVIVHVNLLSHRVNAAAAAARARRHGSVRGTDRGGIGVTRFHLCVPAESGAYFGARLAKLVRSRDTSAALYACALLLSMIALMPAGATAPGALLSVTPLYSATPDRQSRSARLLPASYFIDSIMFAGAARAGHQQYAPDAACEVGQPESAARGTDDIGSHYRAADGTGSDLLDALLDVATRACRERDIASSSAPATAEDDQLAYMATAIVRMTLQRSSWQVSACAWSRLLQLFGAEGASSTSDQGAALAQSLLTPAAPDGAPYRLASVSTAIAIIVELSSETAAPLPLPSGVRRRESKPAGAGADAAHDAQRDTALHDSLSTLRRRTCARLADTLITPALLGHLNESDKSKSSSSSPTTNSRSPTALSLSLLDATAVIDDARRAPPGTSLAVQRAVARLFMACLAADLGVGTVHEHASHHGGVDIHHEAAAAAMAQHRELPRLHLSTSVMTGARMMLLGHVSPAAASSSESERVQHTLVCALPECICRGSGAPARVVPWAAALAETCHRLSCSADIAAARDAAVVAVPRVCEAIQAVATAPYDQAAGGDAHELRAVAAGRAMSHSAVALAMQYLLRALSLLAVTATRDERADLDDYDNGDAQHAMLRSILTCLGSVARFRATAHTATSQPGAGRDDRYRHVAEARVCDDAATSSADGRALAGDVDVDDVALAARVLVAACDCLRCLPRGVVADARYASRIVPQLYDAHAAMAFAARPRADASSAAVTNALAVTHALLHLAAVSSEYARAVAAFGARPLCATVAFDAVARGDADARVDARSAQACDTHQLWCAVLQLYALLLSTECEAPVTARMRAEVRAFVARFAGAPVLLVRLAPDVHLPSVDRSALVAGAARAHAAAGGAGGDSPAHGAHGAHYSAALLVELQAGAALLDAMLTSAADAGESPDDVLPPDVVRAARERVGATLLGALRLLRTEYVPVHGVLAEYDADVDDRDARRDNSEDGVPKRAAAGGASGSARPAVSDRLPVSPAMPPTPTSPSGASASAAAPSSSSLSASASSPPRAQGDSGGGARRRPASSLSSSSSLSCIARPALSPQQRFARRIVMTSLLSALSAASTLSEHWPPVLAPSVSLSANDAPSIGAVLALALHAFYELSSLPARASAPNETGSGSVDVCRYGDAERARLQTLFEAALHVLVQHLQMYAGDAPRPQTGGSAAGLGLAAPATSMPHGVTDECFKRLRPLFARVRASSSSQSSQSPPPIASPGALELCAAADAFLERAVR